MFPMQDFIGGDGVVSIFLKSGRMISLPESVLFEDRITSQNMTLRLRNGEFTQSFRPISYNDGFPIWNQELHIPVHVSSLKTHPSNALIMTLEIFDICPQETTKPTVIGGVVLHLYDIIPFESYSSSFHFFNNDQIPRVIGTVKMKLHFMYGIYGYGYSMQIDNMFAQEKPENKRTLYPKAEQKNFGKDLKPSSEKNIMEKMKEIFHYEELQSKNHNGELSRMNKLQILRNFVLKEDHNSSINLDDSFNVVLEQSIMLRSNLVPARLIKKANEGNISNNENVAYPQNIIPPLKQDQQNKCNNKNNNNIDSENEFLNGFMIPSSSSSSSSSPSNTNPGKIVNEEKSEMNSDSHSELSSKFSNLSENSNQNKNKNKKIKKIRKRTKKRKDSGESSESSLDSLNSESGTM